MLDPVFATLTLETLQQAQRRSRRRWRGCRCGRNGLSEVKAFPPVSLIRNQVLFTLVIAAAIAVAATGFVGYAPNRLVSGRPINLWEAASLPVTAVIVLLGALLLALCFAAPSRPVYYAEAGLAAALLLLALIAAGQAAGSLMLGAKPAVRISLGTAFWVLASCAALAVVDALQRVGAGPAARILAVVAICCRRRRAGGRRRLRGFVDCP